jgi:RNA polymerase sigma-70 factor (ECF subfamily)
LERLYEMLLRAARAELRRRAAVHRIGGPELDDLAHHATTDAVLAIRGKLDQFRYESRFTTWAYRFVILEVSNKLGRRFWKAQNVSLEREEWDQLPERFGFDPQRRTEWQELVTALREAIDRRLTPHQRRLFVAIVLNEVPLDVMVLELGSNRNAIYKTLFDARRKLRRSLLESGHLDSPQRGLHE